MERQHARAGTAITVDWTDRFLTFSWPFATTSPLPPIDDAMSRARSVAADMGTWSELDGRATFNLTRRRMEDALERAALTGIRLAVAHYAAIDDRRRRLSTRWRRGLFRLWCALSVIWLAFVAIVLASQRPALDAAPEILALTVGPPLLLLGLSIVAIRLSIWVVNGFKAGP